MIVPWAEKFYRPVGSGKSVDYAIELTPWCREPMEQADNPQTELTVFIKPIQAGGSSVGEAILLHRMAHAHRGDIAYYWQNDDAADVRWTKHFERKIRACPPVMDRLSTNRHAFTKGLIAFPAFNFVMQGCFSDRNVASDSFALEVLEECHDIAGGWLPGRIAQCIGRTTAYWDKQVFIISNAGFAGSELHKVYNSGTCQHWEVQCPQCKQFHVLRDYWRDDQPELGGLRYSMEGQPKEGEPDYRALAETVFYQMPCGYQFKDTLAERRALSLSGRYGAPTNPGAPLSHRSYTLQAVSVHDIKFIDLIREKQQALAARKRGDPKPWQTYRRERSCEFPSAVDRPEAKAVVITPGRRKNREGLPGRAMRQATADYQQGREGETPHFWLTIRDWMPNGDSMLVWEGKCADSSELVGIVNDHEVPPLCVSIDAGYGAKDIIYPLCLARGYCCHKTEGERGGQAKVYKHEDGSERIYSTPQFLYTIAGTGPTCEDPAQEPRFWLLSKWAAMEKLAWLRASSTKWEVPEDVSEEYKTHMRAWSYTTRRVAMTGEVLPTWKAAEHPEDHLYQCEVYQVVAADMENLIGINAMPEPALETQNESTPSPASNT